MGFKFSYLRILRVNIYSANLMKTLEPDVDEEFIVAYLNGVILCIHLRKDSLVPFVFY